MRTTYTADAILLMSRGAPLPSGYQRINALAQVNLTVEQYFLSTGGVVEMCCDGSRKMEIMLVTLRSHPEERTILSEGLPAFFNRYDF